MRVPWRTMLTKLWCKLPGCWVYIHVTTERKERYIHYVVITGPLGDNDIAPTKKIDIWGMKNNDWLGVGSRP